MHAEFQHGLTKANVLSEEVRKHQRKPITRHHAYRIQLTDAGQSFIDVYHDFFAAMVNNSTNRDISTFSTLVSIFTKTNITFDTMKAKASKPSFHTKAKASTFSTSTKVRP